MIGVASARLGMRAQIALALAGVLLLAAALCLAALRPLTAASAGTARASRRHAGVVLARAVAGQVAALPEGSDVAALLAGAVGPDALVGAALLDEAGRPRARAGTLAARAASALEQRPPFEDRVTTRGDRLDVAVALPGRGAFLAEVSLAQRPGEQGLYLGVFLYTAVASAAALWVVFVLLTRYTVRPVEALTRAAERVAAGRRDAVAEPRGAREVVRAATAFNTMTAELAARERELSARVEELLRTTRELEAAQDQLVRSERLAVVGRLSAGIAHEVGNPLAAIVGLTDVLKEGGLTEAEARDFADRIGREAQRIHRTVRELLDYARAAPADGTAAATPGEGSAEGPVPPARGDVGEAVAQVQRLLAPQKSLRGVVVVDEVASAAAPAVALGTDRLVQVLLNLVLNAVDAARDGDALRVVLSTAPGPDGRVAIEVEDDGPGIPDAIRARVFEPFFTTKPAGEGTGLGLAICAVIVEQAGGTIAALPRRDGGRGARLRLELPRA